MDILNGISVVAHTSHLCEFVCLEARLDQHRTRSIIYHYTHYSQLFIKASGVQCSMR